MKLQDMNLTDQVALAGHKNAGQEFAGHDREVHTKQSIRGF